MNYSILFILMMNLFISLVVFYIILGDNDYNFIKWIKHSFEVRNWFGKLQICLVIIWMLPVIAINIIAFPIAWLLAKIIIGIMLGYEKIVELGKK